MIEETAKILEHQGDKASTPRSRIKFATETGSREVGGLVNLAGIADYRGRGGGSQPSILGCLREVVDCGNGRRKTDPGIRDSRDQLCIIHWSFQVFIRM